MDTNLRNTLGASLGISFVLTIACALVACANPNEDLKPTIDETPQVPISFSIDGGAKTDYAYVDGLLATITKGDEVQNLTWDEDKLVEIASGDNKTTYETKTDPVDGTYLLKWQKSDGTVGKDELHLKNDKLEYFTLGTKDADFVLKSTKYNLTSKERIARVTDAEGIQHDFRWEEDPETLTGSVSLDGAKYGDVVYNIHDNPTKIGNITIEWEDAKNTTPFVRAYSLSLVTKQLVTEIEANTEAL